MPKRESARDSAAVSIHHHQGYVVCAPFGELDAATTPRLREALSNLKCQRRVIIDLTAVTFIDSAGLGALIGAVRRVHDHDGTVSVACHRPSLLRLLEVVGFDKLVPILDTVQSATAATAEAR